MNCRVCGRQFDPTGFQVMVPGLKDGFDRVDCALEASALGLPPATSEPLPAVVRALPAAPAAVPVLAGGPPLAMAGAESMRPQFLAGANLALLAAAAAATVYLWLRVFGADAGLFAFPAPSASPAFERTTVAASIDLTPAPEVKPQPESLVRGGGSQPAAPPVLAVSASGDGGTLVSNRSKKAKKRNQRNPGPVARPGTPPPPPAPPTPAPSAPVPTYPVPSSPPANRVPGPTLPSGGGWNPEQPSLPGGHRG